MNKIILTFFIALGILFKINAYAHTDHYKNIKSIEMEIFKDNKYIGFSKFFFNKTQKKFEVTNITNFKVKLMGIQSDTQISPLSGSIKKQSVEFLKKEKIKLYENEINVEKFRLKSTDESLPKDKRLDFEIWYDKKRAMIVKIRYKRLGTWEYRLKKVN